MAPGALRLAHTILRSSDPLAKRTIMICHGLFGSKQNWNSLSKALHQKGCGTVCMVDLRNHGESPHSSEMTYIAMAQDLAKTVDDLGLQNICLIGHSMGGKAAMCAALLEPERFDRLMIIDASPGHSSGAQTILPYLKLMINADFTQAQQMSDGTLFGVRNWFLEAWKEQIPDDLKRSFLLTNVEKNGESFKWRVNLKVIENCWHHIAAFPTRELNGRVFEKPTVFVAGALSDYIRLSDFPTIHNYFPQAQLLSVAGAGHWVHVDSPHTTLDLISAFVKGPMENPFLDNVTDLTNDGLALLKS